MNERVRGDKAARKIDVKYKKRVIRPRAHMLDFDKFFATK